jgi:hypothetical protein
MVFTPCGKLDTLVTVNSKKLSNVDISQYLDG